LQTGDKWKLPNLYYLSVVLEVDPVVGLLFFTEIRRGIDGYLLCSTLAFTNSPAFEMKNAGRATLVDITAGWRARRLQARRSSHDGLVELLDTLPADDQATHSLAMRRP
jgi:hypothetical protein